MTAEQVDAMIAGLATRTVKGFKVAHCLKVLNGSILCLDVNCWFRSEVEIGPALADFCRIVGPAGALQPAGAADWKRFVTAPRPIPPPTVVRIPETINRAVMIVVRTEQ